jgi:transcriptional antiterminator RfaH
MSTTIANDRATVSLADTARWFVVHSKPREERRALEHLERQGYECYLPERPMQKTRQGRIVVTSEPLFPRYLFIRLDDCSSNWLPIRSTRGVSRLLQFGDRFPSIADDSVSVMRALATTAPTRPLFDKGERLLVSSGPFSGLEALYLEPDGEVRVIALMTLLGQEQRLSLPVAILQRAPA